MSELLKSFDEGVLTLTFNRPERRNALNQKMVDALTEATIDAGQDPTVRCVVLTGAGGAFSGGGDMDDMPTEEKAQASAEVRAQWLRQGMEATRILHEIPKPTLAAINGAAAGGALAFALACDMRICLDTAKVTTAFAKIGTSGDSGMSYLLPRLVGPAKATELMFTADVINGKQAHEMGMMTQAVSADEFEHAVSDYARKLADLPTVAIGYMKKTLRAAEHSTLSEILDLECDRMIRTVDTEDHRNAVAAFLNKQQPKFVGR